jgi:hypothetical protein
VIAAGMTASSRSAPTVRRRKTRPVVRPEERDVREQEEGDACAESDGGNGTERSADVMECRLEAEGEEDDARDHRQVEVAVSVARDSRPLEATGLSQPSSLGAV